MVGTPARPLSFQRVAGHPSGDNSSSVAKWRAMSGWLVEWTGATQSSGVRVAPTMGAHVDVWRGADEVKCHAEMSLRRFGPGNLPNCSAFPCRRDDMAKRICLSGISCDLLRKNSEKVWRRGWDSNPARPLQIPRCQRRQNPLQGRTSELFAGARRMATREPRQSTGRVQRCAMNCARRGLERARSAAAHEIGPRFSWVRRDRLQLLSA